MNDEIRDAATQSAKEGGARWIVAGHATGDSTAGEVDRGPGFIERLANDPAVPVIAISGGTPSVPPDLSLDLAQRSGADLSLRKPFPNDTLLDNLQRLIDQSREAQPPKS